MASGPLLISPLVRNQANRPVAECWLNEGRKNADEEHMLGLPNKLYRRRCPVRRLAVSRAAPHETSRACEVSWEPANVPIRMMASCQAYLAGPLSHEARWSLAMRHCPSVLPLP